MKRLTFLISGLLVLSGCIPILIGAGAVTGYGLSNDAASGTVRTEYRVLWDLCMDELQEMHAEFLSANESAGAIKAIVSGHRVALKIKMIDVETQRLKISARQAFMPKPYFAQKIFFKIVKDLQ